MDIKSYRKSGISGTIIIPSDKSLSHRAVMLSSIAKGKSIIKNFSKAEDPCSTLNICKNLGIDYYFANENLVINSNGKLSAPKNILNCCNSGTTMRLMTGILAGQNFKTILTGDESLSKRPMQRIITPLTMMGAEIISNNGNAPLKINGAHLTGIEYKTPIPSAQVKSAILLAGLFADGKTTVIEDYLSRNHTELMLEFMGANIQTFENKTVVEKSELSSKIIDISGDISSAAYFIAAAILLKKSDLILKNVGINPTFLFLKFSLLIIIENIYFFIVCCGVNFFKLIGQRRHRALNFNYSLRFVK